MRINEKEETKRETALEERGIRIHNEEEIDKELRGKRIMVITGHRPVKLWGYDMDSEGYNELRARINEVINREEIEIGISGMALGVDMIYAEECIKSERIAKLIGAVPCYGQERVWTLESQARYYEILKNDKVMAYYVTRQWYDNSGRILNRRNEWMVEKAKENGGQVLAIWNGSDGGTKNCVMYASKVGVPVTVINPREIILKEEVKSGGERKRRSWGKLRVKGRDL